MQHATLCIILIATFEVVFRVHSHVTRRHKDVLVIRDVHACRVIHLIIGTRGYGERRYGTLAMIEDGIHIRREYTLVFIVHLDCWVSPPEESLRQRGTVAHTALYLQIGTART